MANIRFVLMEGESEDLHGLLDRVGLSPNGGGTRLVIDGSEPPKALAAAPAAAAVSTRTKRKSQAKAQASGCKKCGQPYHSTTHKTKCATPRTTASPETTSAPPGDSPGPSDSNETNASTNNPPQTTVLSNVDTAGF